MVLPAWPWFAKGLGRVFCWGPFFSFFFFSREVEKTTTRSCCMVSNNRSHAQNVLQPPNTQQASYPFWENRTPGNPKKRHTHVTNCQGSNSVCWVKPYKTPCKLIDVPFRAPVLTTDPLFPRARNIEVFFFAVSQPKPHKERSTTTRPAIIHTPFGKKSEPAPPNKKKKKKTRIAS